MKHEILIIPASTVPSFGSTFNIDIKEKNILFHNLTLQFVTGPVVGTNLVGTFNPCWYFMNRLEIVQNGTVIDTVYGNQQFIQNQWLDWDEDRLSVNNAAGNYSTATQRLGMSGQTTSNTFMRT